MYKCEYCNRETKSSRGNKKHQRYCKINANRENHENQFTVARNSGKVIPPGNITRGFKGQKHSTEAREKMSKARIGMIDRGEVPGKNRVKFYEQNPDIRISLYLIEFYNEDEKFLKIGISEHGTLGRFGKNSYFGYNKTILAERIINGVIAAKIERYLLRKFRKNFGYTPKNPFNGRTECLLIEIKDEISENIDKLITRYSGDGEDSNPEAIEFNSLIARQRKKYTWNNEKLEEIEKRNNKLRPLLEKVDFNERGCFSNAAKIIGITPQKTRNFMERNFPDLL